MPPRRPEEIYGKIYIIDNNDPDKIMYFYNIKDSSLAIAIQKAKGLDTNQVARNVFDTGQEVLHPRWNEATILYMKEKDIPRILSRRRTVATCAYSASKAYVETMLGGSLAMEDRDWYEQHHLVTGHGLPQEHSFTVIQQLLEPYNIGISRIIVPPGTRRFDSYMPFIKALGCNPYFLVDGMTTNQKALEMMFPDPVDREKHAKTFLGMWKFECAEEPLKPAILMCQYETKSTGHNGGSTFRGPRARHTEKNWMMSIQLDRLNNIKYLEPMDLPAYKEWDGSWDYDFWTIKDETGKTLREIDRGNWKSSVGFQGNNERTWTTSEPTVSKSADQEWWESVDWETISDADAEKILQGRGYLGKDESLTKSEPKTKETKIDKKEPILDYPPTCETCQRNPGNMYYTNKDSGKKEKYCQFCGTLQERNYQELDWDKWSPKGYPTKF